MIVNFTAPKDMPPAQKATAIVHAYAKMALDSSDPDVTFGVFVVWFCKTLQNWKALVSTTLPDQTYYEVTYDGDQRRTYLDVYKKWNNVVVPDHEEVNNDAASERAEESQAEAATSDNLDERR